MSVACALLLLHLRVDDVACLTALTCFMLASLFVTALYESLCRMRRLAELNSEAHRLAEERLHRIVTSASDAIITIDAEQKITLFSTGAEAIFGYSATEMLGRPLDPLIPERFRQAHHGHIDAFGATGIGTRRMARERLLVGLRRNGEEFPIEAQISQVEVAGQKLYTVILRDVTERKRAEAEREQLLANAERAQRDAENALKAVKQMQSITDAALIEALQSRDRLEISNRRKDEFVAMLSHELRNPLSAVRNALVAADLDESRRSRVLEIARRQTEQLGRLIDDLLDATRLTQGRITLRKERVSIAQILERAVESTRSLVESRNLHLTVAVTPEPLQVEADPIRLEQVFVNLLSNAAKYTEAGGCIDVIAERQN
jgi:PAS domain S-box-containing protein